MGLTWSVCVVHPSMSPKGVEHIEGTIIQIGTHSVHPSMSPKGVEHREIRDAARKAKECIHQCRRKALSTSAANH